MQDNSDSYPGLVPDSDKWAIRGLATLLAYSVVRSLVHAASKPFWFDEVFTWAMARQSGAAAIWKALQNAVDSNPPGYHLIEWTFSRLVPNQEIALRLPSIIGFCCVLACLFVFIRKRSGSAVALCCTAIPLMTVLYDTYAAEARPYTLVVACVSLAMVCYQHAPGTGWMVLMAFSLAVSHLLHYYTVFVLVPFGIAELMLFVNTRRSRWPVWLALAGGFLPFVMCWPLLKAFGAANRSHFWARPSFMDAWSAYGWFFNAPQALGLGIAAVSTLGILTAIVSGYGRDKCQTITSKAPFEEYVFILSLLALPLIMFVGTELAHGGMAHRYAMPAVLAIPIAFGYLLPSVGRKTFALFAIFICGTLLFQEARFWHSHAHGVGRVISPTISLENLVDRTQYGDLPVVVSDGLDYLPIAYYASPQASRRVMALVDPPAAISFCGSDSVDQGLLVLQSYIPLQVYAFSAFASRYPMFLLYSTNQSQFDWWTSRFVKEGDSMTVVALEQDRKLYLVKLATNSR